MSFTYVDPNAYDRDKVRFLAQDTVEAGHSVTDAEITWLLTAEPNVWYAAAQVAELKGNRLDAVKRKKVGDLEIEYDATDYADIAQRLRMRGNAGAAPFAGGISKAAVDATLDNSDALLAGISVGMHDHDAASTST